MRAAILALALAACGGTDDPAEDPADLHRVVACGDSWAVTIGGTSMRPAACEVPCAEVPDAKESDMCRITPEEVGEPSTASYVFTFAGVRGACDSWDNGTGIRFQECL